MHEILDEYRPDFSPGHWSDRDRHFLEAFATNPDGIVSVLRNLPPEITGALCSRASRASGSLLEVLLKEYIYPIVNGDDPRLARELEDTVAFLKDHGFRHILNNQRAQAFYSKWLSQYGDDSIAQVTGTHVIVWGISQVAMKFIEDQRVGLEPIEKSTRYVNFGSKVGGRYLYYIPKPDLDRHGLLGRIHSPSWTTCSIPTSRCFLACRTGCGKILTKKTPFSRRKHSILFAGCCRWRRSARWRFAEMPRLSST